MLGPSTEILGVWHPILRLAWPTDTPPWSFHWRTIECIHLSVIYLRWLGSCVTSQFQVHADLRNWLISSALNLCPLRVLMQIAFRPFLKVCWMQTANWCLITISRNLLSRTFCLWFKDWATLIYDDMKVNTTRTSIMHITWLISISQVASYGT